MESVIFILSLVLISYVGAEWLFRTRKLPFFLSNFFHSGVGFVIIGAMIGPLGFGWVDDQKLELLVSIESIALSLIGIVFGLQFKISRLRRIPHLNYKVAFIQSIVVFLFSFALLLPVRWVVPGYFMSVRETLPFVFALASIACVTSPTAAAAVVRRMNAHGMAARLLRYVTATDSIVGVFLFGITLSFFRMEGMAAGSFLRGLFWIAMTLGVGVLLGFLYHVFLAFRLSSNERLVIAVATVVLSAGVASLLNVSPLFLSTIVGVVLTNFSDTQDRLYRLLVTAKKPIFGLMLILISARWVGFHPLIVSLGIVFVVIRIVGKTTGARVALKYSKIEGLNPMTFGFALTGQGGMAIAMSLDFISRYPNWMGVMLVSVVVVSFVINALMSPYLIRRLIMVEEGTA